MRLCVYVCVSVCGGSWSDLIFPAPSTEETETLSGAREELWGADAIASPTTTMAHRFILPPFFICDFAEAQLLSCLLVLFHYKHICGLRISSRECKNTPYIWSNLAPLAVLFTRRTLKHTDTSRTWEINPDVVRLFRFNSFFLFNYTLNQYHCH